MSDSASRCLDAACGEQVLPAGLAHLEPLAIGENDGSFVLAFPDDLLQVLHVDDDGAMDAYEFLRIKRARELFDGFAQHEVLGSDMQARIVVRSFDPFD